ncbi:ubiquitin domain-containing protein 2-like [Pistacia vera]|uniref:ubiquitin domain-containing protein 2-like n=1 Tax=Pistacia vera TaxID=55513 RepID=UPI0012639571|nr:ubiquitin domain-containing protein 2-like [Pistacia vera]
MMRVRSPEGKGGLPLPNRTKRSQADYIFPLEISPALSMGCTGSTRAKGDESAKKIRKPKPWKHSETITRTQLMQLRDEFWDTAPHYGGRKVLRYNLDLAIGIGVQNYQVNYYL